MKLFFLVLLVLFAAIISSSCANKSVTEQYFENAEVQAENDMQRHNVLTVLEDLSNKDPNVVFNLRYPDYLGNTTWKAIDVVKHHILPGKPVYLSEYILYKDLSNSKNREIIKQFLAKYKTRLVR